MLRRQDIRYGNVGVRLVCCVWIAAAVANLVHFGSLAAWEAVAAAFLARTFPGAAPVPQAAEYAAVFLLCLAPAVLRIERPVAMLGCGLAFAAAYGGLSAALAWGAGRALPTVAPLLGLTGATLVLQTMAWSEERTRRRRLERLEAAKQQFTDMLVHDLRRRVSSIRMSFSLLEEEFGERPGTVGELLNTIDVTTERALVEISDLLDIRRIQEGKLPLQRETLALRRVLQELVDEHRPASRFLEVGIRLADPGAAAVRADPAIFSRILANLLWNALQHAPRGSEVSVRCGAGADGSVLIRIANRGRTIPPDQQAAVFDAYVSAAPQGEQRANPFPGTGLGLAFCKLAAEAHGGTVAILSPWQESGDGVEAVLAMPPPEA